MYRKIMVPTDGSGFDREAILVALRIAERCRASVTLIRVLSARAYFGTGATPEVVMATPETMRLERDAAESELHALAEECRGLTAVELTESLEQGPVVDALAGYAKRNDIDLIVISSHGRRGIARLSLGSVTDSLIRGTTIPVLVVKPKASYLTPEASKEFHHIVVPLDGSALAEQVLARVAPLAEVEEADVTLPHVVTPSEDDYANDPTRKLPWWEKKFAGARAYLTRRAIELNALGVPAMIDVVIGEKIGDTITDYARRCGADLIAVATHGRGGLARVIHGSVADAITKSAMSSILVFHPDNAGQRTLSSEGAGKAREEAAAFA